jgi:hypothetical protein
MVRLPSFGDKADRVRIPEPPSRVGSDEANRRKQLKRKSGRREVFLKHQPSMKDDRRGFAAPAIRIGCIEGEREWRSRQPKHSRNQRGAGGPPDCSPG